MKAKDQYDYRTLVTWNLRDDARLIFQVATPVTVERLLEVAVLVRQIDVILRRRKEIDVPQKIVPVARKVAVAQ